MLPKPTAEPTAAKIKPIFEAHSGLVTLFSITVYIIQFTIYNLQFIINDYPPKLQSNFYNAKIHTLRMYLCQTF